MKKARIFELEHDVYSSAGWLYADMFLGLMVIFLAIVSFIPQSQNMGKTQIPSVTHGAADHPQVSQLYTGLTLFYETPSVNKLIADSQNYLKEKKLSLNSHISFIQIIGPFNPISESKDMGTARAVKFGLALRSQDSNFIGPITIGVSASSDIPINQIALQITFSPSR
jgi:hypothetical protein